MSLLAASLRRVLVLPIAAAAYGWQTHVRTLPGPRISLALPLQEPSHHASVSLPGLVVVWLAAFAIAGVVAPARRLPRPAAAAIRGLATFGVMVVVQAVSLQLVREATLGFAWHAALIGAGPAIAGGCAAFGTLAVEPLQRGLRAALAAARRRRSRSPRALLHPRAKTNH
jgi:hypothetical protein